MNECFKNFEPMTMSKGKKFKICCISVLLLEISLGKGMQVLESVNFSVGHGKCPPGVSPPELGRACV